MSELFEAPITDYTIHDQEGGTSFSQVDRKLLRSPKGREKIIRAFSKTPFDIEVHYVINDAFDGESEWDNGAIDEYAMAQGAGIHKEFTFSGVTVTGKPGVISVMMLSNLSDETTKIPMTAWILGHKIGHSMQDHLVNNKTEWGTKLGKHIVRLTNAVNALSSFTADALKQYDNKNFEHPRDVQDNLTMKSARDRKLSNSFEIFPELIAQYLISGKITLAYDYPELEASINKTIELILKQLVGKVLVEL